MGWDGLAAVAEAREAKKKKDSASRNWIRLDCNGKGTILDADKHVIMERLRINGHDLRILDPLLSYPSAIMGRERAIVLNLEHIKAIITADEVLLRDPSEDEVVPIVEELCRRLSSPNVLHQGQDEGKENLSHEHNVEAASDEESPFEFRALEVALEAICGYLDARATELAIAANPVLDELTSKVTGRNLDKLRKIKSAMTRVISRIQKVRDALSDLLDDDREMADLYLSRKLVGTFSTDYGASNLFPTSPSIGSKISRACRASTTSLCGRENDVEDLEMLLEAYFIQIDGSYNKLTTLREHISDTEDFINIQLDNHRNQLIQLDVFLSSCTACLSFYSLIAGVFGMNMPYQWTVGNHPHVFIGVVAGTGAIAIVALVLIIGFARYKGLIRFGLWKEKVM